MKRGGLPVLALISLLSTNVAAAQSKNTSEIRGTITDPSGAVVPGAKITVTSTGTGAVKETLANDRGEYRVVLLPPGTYDVRAENTGFVTQTRKGIAVTVGQTTVIDVQLAVGATTELVEVSGEAPLVETERSQQANTIDELAVRNLPINRRDYLTFALLAPGIADSKALADANSFRVKQTPDSGISFYGSNGR
ncbi:MAG: TonB-dependent receptor, partial [Acidobacteria bacterium]